VGNAVKITKGKVFEFVKKEIVHAHIDRLACADGRYNQEQSRGAIRAFGADMGPVMALAATLKDHGIVLSPEEIIDRYVGAKRELFGEDITIDYHCDEHNHHEGSIGCGHIGKAAIAENDGLYGSLNHVDVINLFDAFTQNPASKITVLEGKHEERGVIFVHKASDTNETYTVNSRDNKGQMYFVVNPDDTHDYIEQITPLFSRGLSVGLNAAEVEKNYTDQMSATAKLLQADKLPWYKLEAGKRFRMEQISPKSVQASV
jgi:hypothetical protein